MHSYTHTHRCLTINISVRYNYLAGEDSRLSTAELNYNTFCIAYDKWCEQKPTARAPLTAKNIKQQHNRPMKNNTCKTVSCHVRLTVHKYGPEARLGPGLNWTGWWIRWWWMDRRTGGGVGGTESRERIKSETEIVWGAGDHIQRRVNSQKGDTYERGSEKKSWGSCEISAASLQNREGVKALGCNRDETKPPGRAADLGWAWRWCPRWPLPRWWWCALAGRSAACWGSPPRCCPLGWAWRSWPSWSSRRGSLSAAWVRDRPGHVKVVAGEDVPSPLARQYKSPTTILPLNNQLDWVILKCSLYQTAENDLNIFLKHHVVLVLSPCDLSPCQDGFSVWNEDLLPGQRLLWQGRDDLPKSQ